MARKASVVIEKDEGKGVASVTLPFHSGAVLHPKIVRKVLDTIEEAGPIISTEQ